MTRKLIREIPNKFEASCRECNLTVREGAGVALLYEHRGTEYWRTVHSGCRAVFVERMAIEQTPTTGPVAASAVAQANQQAASVEALLAAPSLSVDDAETMQGLLEAVIPGMVNDVATATAAVFNETVPGMVAELLASARPVVISVGDAPPVTVEQSHKALEDVLLMVVAGTSPFLVGPAGSGKTTLAQQIADCLGRSFFMASRVTSEYKLTGFIDAQGKVVRTPFREAYEHGGVFLFDEVDASDADALTAFNAALAGKLADFPDGIVQRHPDFVAIAAGNTFGRGADRQYVGRNQLDAATLDRFQVYEVDYDEGLELKLAGNDDWTRHCQRVRAAIEAEKVRHVVSPRASIAGAKLLAAGMAQHKVEESCIWKGLAATDRARVMARMAGSN